MPDERQPDAESGVPARRAAVGLAESLEDVGQELVRDSFPGVADHDLEVAAGPGSA